MAWLFRHEARFLSSWTSLSWPGTWNILHSLLCLYLWVGWDLGFRVEVTSVVRKKRAQLCGLFCFVSLPVQGLILTWTTACFPLDFWSGFIGFLRALCEQSLRRCGLWTVCCTFANLGLLLFLSFIYLFFCWGEKGKGKCLGEKTNKQKNMMCERCFAHRMGLGSSWLCLWNETSSVRTEHILCTGQILVGPSPCVTCPQSWKWWSSAIGPPHICNRIFDPSFYSFWKSYRHLSYSRCESTIT